MINKFKEAIPLIKWGIYALAWNKENALQFIKSILEEDIGILGGDVYLYNSEKIQGVGDNWFSDRKPNEISVQYNYRSKKESYDYIKNYPLDKNIIFSLILTDNTDVNIVLDIEPNYKIEAAKKIDETWLMCPYCMEVWVNNPKDQMIWCEKCKKRLLK